MQVKCNACGAMFFLPNVKKGKEVSCRKCGAKTVAEPSKEAGARLAETIRETAVNDLAAETYSKMAADSTRAEKTAPEPGDKVVAWALRIYGILFFVGAVLGVVAMDGNGMDDWQGPAAVALIGAPLPALLPVCSFAAFFKSRNRTKRRVRWLARSEGTPPSDLGDPAGSTKGWGAFYVIMGVLFLVGSLHGLSGALALAAESEDSYYGSRLAKEVLGWQISLCSGVLLLGVKNLLLSALFQGQARFAGEVAELFRSRTDAPGNAGPESLPAPSAAPSENPS